MGSRYYLGREHCRIGRLSPPPYSSYDPRADVCLMSYGMALQVVHSSEYFRTGSNWLSSKALSCPPSHLHWAYPIMTKASAGALDPEPLPIRKASTSPGFPC